MIQLLDPDFPIIEEEEPLLDISMPRVYRQPAMPILCRGRKPIWKLLTQAQESYLSEDPCQFHQLYGQLLSEFNPTIQWALSCWDYLLSTEGCRFIPRTLQEKSYCRGDYRGFLEKDLNSLVHRAFKECLIRSFADGSGGTFQQFLKEEFWSIILVEYRDLSHPPDPKERLLTPYSYLRCIPYQFLNPFHQQRVHNAIKILPQPLQQVVSLYNLRFQTQEAVLDQMKISIHAFWRRRQKALRTLMHQDRLSLALLTQIERY